MKFLDWYLKIGVVSAAIGGSMEYFMIKTGFWFYFIFIHHRRIFIFNLILFYFFGFDFGCRIVGQ
uniref:Uncharacterized protein n=1 Tax=Helianthus annuus TaxID=4232 RepID=A0A251TGL9_HELAN